MVNPSSKDVSHEFRDGPIRAYATDGCVRIEANDVESGDDAEVYLDVSEARAFHAWLGRVLGVHETSPQVTPYVCPECKIEAGFHEMTCSRWTASATHETSVPPPPPAPPAKRVIREDAPGFRTGPTLDERHERELDEALKERDRAQDALQETHIILGGDGEWKGRLPPQEPPDSGDLHLDVPALARERMGELAVWAESCTGRHGSQMPCVGSQLKTSADDPRIAGAPMDKREHQPPEPLMATCYECDYCKVFTPITEDECRGCARMMNEGRNGRMRAKQPAQENGEAK